MQDQFIFSATHGQQAVRHGVDRQFVSAVTRRKSFNLMNFTNGVKMVMKSLLLLALLPLPVWAASFDCQKPKNTAEKMICADAELSKLDAQLAQAYRGALKALHSPASIFDPDESRTRLVQEQKNWITYVRNICQDTACLQEAYQSRIQLLKYHDVSKDAWPQIRWIDPGGNEYPDDKHAGRVTVYESDPNQEILLFNQVLHWNHKSGKIIGCNKLIGMHAGTSADTFAGICILRDKGARALIYICNNNIGVIGNNGPVIELININNSSIKALINFAIDRCGIGG
jgi:uncharacterized protein